MSHYCLIRNFDRFLSRTKKCHARSYFCYYCLCAFTSRHLLSSHIALCQVNFAQKIKLPSPGNEDSIKFSDHLKAMRIPFVIHADFETIQKPIQTCDAKSHTTPTKHPEVCSYGYKVVCEVDKYTKPVKIYRGPNAADKFITDLMEEQRELKHF